MGASVTTCTVQSVTSRGPDSRLSVGEEALERIFWLERTGAQSSRDPGKKLDLTKNPLSGATKLGSEMEFRGSGATAVEQHLLQSETPGKNGLQATSSDQVGRTLRWFTTVVLNAAFLGMVRAEAVTTCTLDDLYATLLNLPGPGEWVQFSSDMKLITLMFSERESCAHVCWPRWLDRNVPSGSSSSGPDQSQLAT